MGRLQSFDSWSGNLDAFLVYVQSTVRVIFVIAILFKN